MRRRSDGCTSALPRVLARACAVVALALAGLAAQESDPGPRGFAIPETREARALAERAREHLAAGRWSDAFAALQELLTTHRGEVLRPPGAADAAREDEAVRLGAAVWASAQLAALPVAARELYAARYGAESSEALRAAQQARDPRALLEVARRYPLTAAAEDAWWSLGDLEFELGELEAARASWTRGAELARTRGAQPGRSAAARLELAASLGEAAAAPAQVRALPDAEAVTWTQSFARSDRLTPFSVGSSNCIHPAVSGDTVLVSDSLKLFAFDAWSGEPRWETPEPEGWAAVDRGEYRPLGNSAAGALSRREFFENLHRRTLLVRPAAAAGVAVVALQIPHSAYEKTNFQNYEITSVIPERRLYAFDLASGRELWNHRPPPVWDGESGPVEQRMSVAAPPVIAGARVIVPYYRMQGRVDLHVGCFDLYTGARLWSSSLISGQVALNMFGRQFHEFCAAPATVVGDKVLVVTHLGAVAALDLYSGDLVWESLYEQIPVPRANHWETSERPQVWASAAPVVTGSVVLATPIDALDLLAFDLATGERLWSRPQSAFRRSSRELLTLLGADAQRVWVSGMRVLSLRSARGLALAAPSELSDSADVTNLSEWPRPLLTERHVLVATPGRRVALLRDALRQEERDASAEWSDGQRAGNVAALDGALFFATSSTLFGVIDWRAVEERFRRRSEAAPGDPAPALDWAALLERRGLVELEAGRIERALDLFASARAKVEPFAGPRDDGARGEASGRLFSLSLSESRALELAADPKAALERLELALPLASDPGELLRVNVRRIDLLEVLGQHERRAALLGELVTLAADRDMPDEWWQLRGRERFAASLPSTGALERMPVSLFVALELARDARRSADASAELRQLHALLAVWGDVELPLDPPASVSVRIGELAHSEPAAFAPFEARAEELLKAARESGDLAALERLPALFPHSRAAVAAERARLEAALAERDWGRVVASVQRSVPDDWAPEVARESELQALLVLRAALQDAGNAEFADALARRLARNNAALVSTLERDGGKSLAELAPPLPERSPPPLDSELSEFDARSKTASLALGQHALLGHFEVARPAGARERIALVRVRAQRVELLQAFAPARPQAALWSQTLEQGSVRPGTHAELSAGTLLVAGLSSITGLDPLDGSVLWRWSTAPARLEFQQASAGAVFAITRSTDGRATLVAIDARAGIQLWARAIPAGLWAHRPVVGAEHLVLLPSDWAQSPAVVLDPFTGSRMRVLRLTAHVGEADAAGAWIEGNRLILPSFPKGGSAEERDCLTAWDLDSGARAWRVACEEGREFDSIVRCGADAYLVYLASGGTSGAVLQLNLRIGAVRRLQSVSLDADDVLVGVRRHGVVQLGGPYLVLRSASADGQATEFQAVQLPFGKTWTYKLPLPPAQLYNSGPMPLPVISRSALVLAYTETPRTRGQVNLPRTSLVVLDRESGLLRETGVLPAELGTAETLELSSLGPTLWIAGSGAMQIRTQ